MNTNKTFANPPKINLLTMLRLGLFQMGLSMMSILTLGVLNRVMIQELTIPATIVAVLVAIPFFVAPARIWFGQLSDTQKLFGSYRTGYVLLGAIVFAGAAFIAVQMMWQLGDAVQTEGGIGGLLSIGWMVLLALTFIVYGLAMSASATAFMALLVDISEEESRSKLVGIVWSLLMVGVIIGAILSGSLLNQLTANSTIDFLQSSVNRLFVVVPALVLGLAFLATFCVE
ncbi:MAG TPA: PucC family protein, partial [Allocoleopsis sp.]